MKVVKQFRLFKKIKRKYYKQNSVKRYWKYNGKRRVSYWFDKDFVGYLINTKEDFIKQNIHREIEMSLSTEYLDNSESFLINLLEKLSNNTEYGVDIISSFKNEIHNYRFFGYLLTNRDIYYYVFDEQQSQYFLLPFINEVKLLQ